MLLIIFSNLTLTTKFKKLAGKNSISGVRIIQTPRQLSGSGCSYSVRAPLGTKDALFDLMKREELFPESVFKVESLKRGKVTYVRLK